MADKMVADDLFVVNKSKKNKEVIMSKSVDFSTEPPVVGHAVSNYRVDLLTDTEWREIRKNSLGCSEAAAAAGLNKYRSPLDVYMQKKGYSKGFTGNIASRMGSALEPFIASEFTRETGLKCHEVVWNLSHPEEPRFTATLDRVCYEPWSERWAVVELKNPGWRQRSEWEGAVESGRPGAGTTIESYFYQLVGQMSVTGFDVGYLVGLIEKKMYIIRVDRDKDIDDLCSWIPMQVKSFWSNHIDKDVPPTADGRDKDLLGALYDSPKKGSEVFDESMLSDVEQLRQIRENIKSLNNEADELVVSIKSRMGNSEKLVLGEGVRPVRWGAAKTTRFDSTSFKKAHPELYTEYTSVSSSRRFSY